MTSDFMLSVEDLRASWSSLSLLLCIAPSSCIAGECRDLGGGGGGFATAVLGAK